MVLSDIYETRYGIYNHLSGNNRRRPLASVALHPKEDYLGQSRLKMHYLRYLSEEVYALTGEKFDDFMNQPSFIIEMKFEALAEYRKMVKDQKAKMEQAMADGAGIKK